MNFNFSRSRGIVWVCDIAASSRHLNNDNTVSALETFIPRLHWAGAAIVEAAGGIFVKWTGDGFLAWFEIELHRDIPRVASIIFEAIWHLSFMVNITQLDVKSEKPIKLRHGVAFEHDALITTITHPGGFKTMDITGRGVVLAFRLSSAPATFPCVVSTSELTEAYKSAGSIISFRKWAVSRDDRLRYFKGEKWGTSGLVVSAEKKHRMTSTANLLRKARKAIDAAEGHRPTVPSGLVDRIFAAFQTGPEWCKPVVIAHADFVKNKLLHSVKELAAQIDANHKSMSKHQIGKIAPRKARL